MKYRCIDRRRVGYPIRMMCRLLSVSPSGYYGWRTRPQSSRGRENRKLTAEIRTIHAESDGTYGSPRMWDELNDRGFGCSLNRVSRLMRLAGICGVPKRKYRRTTDSDHGWDVAANILERDFAAGNPNERWAGDITYIRTGEGWLYLAVVRAIIESCVQDDEMKAAYPGDGCCHQFLKKEIRREEGYRSPAREASRIC